MADREPSGRERIIAAFNTRGGVPLELHIRAAAGVYDEFTNNENASATPMEDLTRDLRQAGLHDLAQRAMDGEFEAARWESDEWAATPEGLAAEAEFNNPRLAHIRAAAQSGAELNRGDRPSRPPGRG